jgi:beta-glucosidase
MDKNNKKVLKFPNNFFWGSSTSAHQVEGGNQNDWSEWERKNAEQLAGAAKNNWRDWQKEKFPKMVNRENYISGKACDHYNRYEEDFDIAKKLHHNAHRFSIEWSRIEPEEGKFDEKEIEHYRKVIKALRARGIEPFVTLWHWTNPVWVAKIGGPENKKFSFYFSRYVKYAVENLGDLVNYWITLNEPTSVISNSFFLGVWPPQKKSMFSALRVYKNLADAHNEAYDKIHKIFSSAKIGFSNIFKFIEPYNPKSLSDKFVAKEYEYFANKKFFKLTKNKNDFLSIQYYFHDKVKFPFKVKNENKEVSDLGWEIYPEGIYHILKKLKQFNLPIYITENGLADADDSKREKFIIDHLYWVHKSIQEEVDVQGYFYWSLLDNFEWDKGFWPRFGLVEMDYKTLERKIRPSAKAYAEICKNSLLEIN